MNRHPRRPMKRLALTVLAVLLLAGGSLVRPAGAEDAKPLAPASLHDAWKTVEGRSGRLRHDEKGYVFAVSLRDKVGEVVVESVGSDCVVLVGQGSGEKWHSVLPLVRVELQIYR